MASLAKEQAADYRRRCKRAQEPGQWLILHRPQRDGGQSPGRRQYRICFQSGSGAATVALQRRIDIHASIGPVRRLGGFTPPMYCSAHAGLRSRAIRVLGNHGFSEYRWSVCKSLLGKFCLLRFGFLFQFVLLVLIKRFPHGIELRCRMKPCGHDADVPGANDRAAPVVAKRHGCLRSNA